MRRILSRLTFVRQHIAYSALHVKLCFKYFYCHVAFNKRIFASGWFVRMENNRCTPIILTFMSKNVLRISDSEIIKIFMNIQPLPNNLDVLIQRRV